MSFSLWSLHLPNHYTDYTCASQITLAPKFSGFWHGDFEIGGGLGDQILNMVFDDPVFPPETWPTGIPKRSSFWPGFLAYHYGIPAGILTASSWDILLP